MDKCNKCKKELMENEVFIIDLPKHKFYCVKCGSKENKNDR